MITSIFSGGEYQVNLVLGPVTIVLQNIVNPGSVSSSSSGILLMVTTLENYLSQESINTDLIASASVAKSIDIADNTIYT